ncbi:MAG: phosphoribosylglycinamide formyltransferase [Actinomycetota bacterium]
MSARLAVLVSGGGSNLQAVLDACASGALPARVVGVVSNRADAFALERARLAGVPNTVVPPLSGEARSDYDARLRDAVQQWQPDVVVLAGFMRVLSRVFLDAFALRVVNLHPALPGELPGVRAIERAHAEAVAGRRTRSGVMVHLVPDEGVDDGPVLAVAEVPMTADESFESFATRMHAAEHRLLVDALVQFLDLSSKGAQP